MEDIIYYDLSNGWNSLTAEVLYYYTKKSLINDKNDSEISFLKKKLSENKGLALDVACGTGRHMLRLIRSGFKVHGLDASVDAINFAEKLAKENDLSAIFHHQKMEEMNLSDKFNTIYILNGSFQIMHDRNKAQDVLYRFLKHLVPGGEIIIELFIPEEAYDKNKINQNKEEELWKPVESASGNEKISTIFFKKSFNLLEQTFISERRCDLYTNKRKIRSELHSHIIRWFYKFEFILMLEKAGFKNISLFGDYLENTCTDKSNIYIYTARKPLQILADSK